VCANDLNANRLFVLQMVEEVFDVMNDAFFVGPLFPAVETLIIGSQNPQPNKRLPV
jgi:hypothetical protein